MRPATLDEMVGQRRLVSPDSALRQSIEAGAVHSMVLWGPPGCGKTTLALLLARYADAEFRSVSAVLSGLPEVRQALAGAAHPFAAVRRLRRRARGVPLVRTDLSAVLGLPRARDGGGLGRRHPNRTRACAGGHRARPGRTRAAGGGRAAAPGRGRRRRRRAPRLDPAR